MLAFIIIGTSMVSELSILYNAKFFAKFFRLPAVLKIFFVHKHPHLFYFIAANSIFYFGLVIYGLFRGFIPAWILLGMNFVSPKLRTLKHFETYLVIDASISILCLAWMAMLL